MSDFGIVKTTFAEALKKAEDRVPFVVDGLISGTSTLIYGEGKAGKSFFVSALLVALTTGEGEFLGRTVNSGRPFRPAVCWTDDDGDGEYSSRMSSVLPGDTDADVLFYELPIMRSQAHWLALRDRLLEDGRNFVVIDNLTQALHGTVNDDAAVRQFFEGIRLFTRTGIPVVIVGHSSEKRGQNGQRSEYPMGSSAITQSVRAKVFYSSNAARDRATLKVSGAGVTPWTMTLNHGQGARFSVIERKDTEALNAERGTRQRDRSNATLDRNGQVARWIVAECQGKGRNAAASAVAAKFGGSAETVKTHLSKGTAYGCLVAAQDGNRWALAGPLAG